MYIHMILDGKAIAEDLYARLRLRRGTIDGPVTLGIVVVGKDPVIESFVRIKGRAADDIGVELIRVDLSAGVSTDDCIHSVVQVSNSVDALIVQLPLPSHIDTDAVLSAIPKEKDVDAINPTIGDEDHPVSAPVALAVMELLKRGSVEVNGTHAVIVGNGRLVGRPTATLLRQGGADVKMFTLEEGSLDDLQYADIIVCGAGNPGMIKSEHIKDGVALIDAGTSEQGGAIMGDADPSCAEKARVFTPVPGGVGPVAVAMIFKNLLDLVEKARR